MGPWIKAVSGIRFDLNEIPRLDDLSIDRFFLLIIPFQSIMTDYNS